MVVVSCLLVALTAGSTVARAQARYRQLDLAELTQRAGIIVQGRVLEARYEPVPGYPHVPSVRVTLAVEEVLRGDLGKQYTFRQLLLFLDSRSGKRAYGTGDRLLLFLPAPSRYGLSSPLGGAQGRFHIFPDAHGNLEIVNELDNAGLFRNVAEKVAHAGLSLSESQSSVISHASGPAPLGDFVSLVKKLTTLPRLQ
jgi:hypothetical protein